MIELFLVCSDEEVKKRLQKRAKKERRKNGTGKIRDKISNNLIKALKKLFRWALMNLFSEFA